MPAQWQGSVEHFYHFLLGYFVPLVLWQDKTGETTFTVRDCSPMNAWFELLHPDTHLNYIAPGVMLERYLSHRQERTVLHDWDNPERFHSRSLRRVSDVIWSRIALETSVQEAAPIVIITRGAESDFYRSESCEVAGSANRLRSIPNIEGLANTLSKLGNVEVLDLASLPPESQVARMRNTKLVVAQHGAGLANAMWLPDEAAVLEIKPPLAPIIDTIFSNLCAALKLDYAAVAQFGPHSEVAQLPVLKAAERLMGSVGRAVPRPPGRWPTRLKNKLPRSL